MVRELEATLLVLVAEGGNVLGLREEMTLLLALSEEGLVVRRPE